jgi:hypothetical protein
MERVLVCLLGATRAHELTFPSFKRRVLDELSGDLAMALTIDETYAYANPFWQHAKYRWTGPDFSDYGEGFDQVQRWLCQQHKVPAPDWRSMLRLNGNWQGRIASQNPQFGNGAIEIFVRWLLLHGLQQDNILDRYDRFVITRSDFVWLAPHPPLSVLDKDAIWIPDGEKYSGLNTRHLVASRADVADCLNLIEDIVLRPTRLYEEMKYLPVDSRYGWNMEQFLQHHLCRKERLRKVKLFPCVMYLARSVRDDGSKTWSRGRYEPAVGHFVKYEEEFHAASTCAKIIHGRADWESGVWRHSEAAARRPDSLEPHPGSPARRPASLPRRLRYACERPYYEAYYRIRSALRQPGRFGRLGRFSKRLVRRTPKTSSSRLPRQS